ncbi:MAG: hypothetical protein ACJ749_16045 [Flavisolibacter sp.]
MSRTILFFAILLASCNNSGGSSDDKDTTKAGNSTGNAGYSWTKDDENEFLNDCVDSLKSKKGADTAYIQCNCALKQLKAHFPNLDSADSYIRNDSKGAADYTKDCF